MGLAGVGWGSGCLPVAPSDSSVVVVAVAVVAEERSVARPLAGIPVSKAPSAEPTPVAAIRSIANTIEVILRSWVDPVAVELAAPVEGGGGDVPAFSSSEPCARPGQQD